MIDSDVAALAQMLIVQLLCVILLPVLRSRQYTESFPVCAG